LRLSVVVKIGLSRKVYRTECLRELPRINRGKPNKEFLIAMASALLPTFTTTLWEGERGRVLAKLKALSPSLSQRERG